jgi:hypothetical protein
MIEMLCLADAADQGLGVVPSLLLLLLAIAMIVGLWKVFEKAGLAGWLAVIPVVNVWCGARVAGLPGWVGLLTFVPVVGFLVGFFLLYKLGLAFGKSVPFIVGMILLPFIFVPLLGFGPDQYQGTLGDHWQIAAGKQG